MSLKDNLSFNGLPLPGPGSAVLEYVVEGIDGVEDQLEVRVDGSLWRNSNSPNWLNDAVDPQPHWAPESLTGELLVFDNDLASTVPLRWSLYLVDGQLRELHRVDSRRRRVVADRDGGDA